MVLGDLDNCMQKNETWSPSYTLHKYQFKVCKRLIYNSWHHNVLQEIIGREISYIPCGNIFTDTSPKAGDIKERINKWDLIKLKSFHMTKENSIKMKREPTVLENVFANDTSDKGLITKIYKELTWLHSRKTNNPIRSGQRTWTDTSPRRTYGRTRDIWKDAQHH